MSSLSSKKLKRKKNSKILEKDDIREKTNKYNDEIIIGKYSDAPDYLKDNEYIKNGYLINCQSLKLVIRSIFVCSNETINIWSHLMGCILSILLIFCVYIFIRPNISHELSSSDYEDLQLKINETFIPWSYELRKHKQTEIIDSNISLIIDNILLNTENLVANNTSKVASIQIIETFIENTKFLIQKIANLFSKESFILEDITTKWDNCINTIFDFIKYGINQTFKEQNLERWPLFIMLSAAIVCFGFSTSFHWFSVYSKNLYSLLCRLDYAGITFLIPGSCYPPYFYFYYCDKCKI